MQNTFYLKSLGCKTNQVEGQIIAQTLLGGGYKQTKSPKEADIYILNSCSVTSHSDKQAIYIIKQVKKENPSVKIILTGCMAQTYERKNEIDADLILGNNEKLDILKYINSFFKDGAKEIFTPDIFVDNIFNVKEFNHKVLKNPANTRPSVKIQEGCNNRCSYCLIPFARGNSRSDSVENIISQIDYLAKMDYKEVVLTGIHIGEWGIENKQTLLDLLKEIDKTDIKRYRLGSLYINEITDETIDFLKNSEKFCPHFHLSLQSMCDKTLSNMNRKYTANEAIKLVNKLNTAFDLPFLGCDIITGFPMESEEDFIATYNSLKNAGLSYIHSFPYSIREGTKAASMGGHLQEHIKKERTKRLMELSNALHGGFLDKNMQKTHEVLFQKKPTKEGLYCGVTRNYIKVYKKSDTNIGNTIVIDKLEAFDSFS